MSKPNNGGPAYPQHGWSSDPEILERMQENCGMSLRDYFAGQIMNGLISYRGILGHTIVSNEDDRAIIAKSSYDIAAAMIAERSKRS